DEAFPGSLFVLTIRDLEDWLRSCERFWAAFHQFAAAPKLRALHQRLYGSADFDRNIYMRAYHRHLARVAGHFARRPGDLLRLNICAGDAWPPLAAFLDIAPPAIPFPHERASPAKRRGKAS